MTQSRGIIILTKNSSGCKTRNVELIDKNSTILFDIILPDLTVINVVAVYAPNNDDPIFFETANKALANRQSQYQLMIGDFNTTLNFPLDTTGYSTDPHKKCRSTINGWLNTDQYVDTYRLFHPDRSSYTFRTRNGGKRGRLDYALSTPTLANHIIDISHIPHSWEVSDHSTVLVKVDFNRAEKGKGIFRAGVSIHRNMDYQRLIKNTIKMSIFCCLKHTRLTKLQQALVKARVEMEGRLAALERTPLDWPTTDRINSLRLQVALLISKEPSIEELILLPREINDSSLLEFILHKMKEVTITFSKALYFRRRVEKEDLIKALTHALESQVTEANKKLISELEQSLQSLENQYIREDLEKKASFTLLEDERPSKAFLNMESRKAGYSEVTRMKIPNAKYNKDIRESPTNKKYNETTSQTEIRDHMRGSFQSIYNKQTGLDSSDEGLERFMNLDDDTEPLNELNKRKLPTEMSDSMEGQLTTEELTEALFKHMKGASSPGVDGFTVNHLRVFWHELKIITRNALNATFGNNLTISLRTAIVKMLRKGEKDPMLSGNYRPISLLSIFYKLASCCITQRIKPAVEHIVGQQQKAYVASNNIGSCILNLINMMSHVNKIKKQTLILLIDFKKAFDSLDHKFLNTALKKMGFGPDIIEWVRLFFNEREAYILMGGHLTDKIRLGQGVPQGDVISPYIFILTVEILLIKINYSKNLKGIKYAKYEGRSETFADDTTIYLERSEKNLRTAINYIESFATISGLSCNLDKTCVVPCGVFNHKEQLCQDLDLVWAEEFTILGFTIDNRLKKLHKNYDKAYSRVTDIINRWKSYHLSLQGRITIAKVMLIPQYTYIGSVLDTLEQNHYEKIQAQINAYIIHNDTLQTKDTRHNWISSSVLYSPKNKGGLGMIRITDFLDSLKISWIRRYTIQQINDHWCDILDIRLGLTPDTRKNLLNWGPYKLDKAIAKGIPSLSQFLAALKRMQQNFVTDPGAGDNRWLKQPIYYSNNITVRKFGQDHTYLEPKDYGMRDIHSHIRVIDVYESLKFITKEKLETKFNLKMCNLRYHSFKNHITRHIGHNKKYSAIAKEVKPRRFTSSTVEELMEKNVKGSGVYRKELARGRKMKNFLNPESWQAKLSDQNITENDIKQSLISLHSPLLPRDIVDYKTRLVLHKTQFRLMINKHKEEVEPWCQNCIREEGVRVNETALHALYDCPAVNYIIGKIANDFELINDENTLRPGKIIINSPFTANGKLDQTKTDLSNVIWCTVLKEILNARGKDKTPVYSIVLAEVLLTLHNIVINIKGHRVTVFIKSRKDLMRRLTASGFSPHVGFVD